MSHVYCCSIDQRNRDIYNVRRKWTYLKTSVTSKYSEIMKPKTGGGTPKTLTELEKEICDFLHAMRSVKLDGIPSGIDTLVIYNYGVKLLCIYRLRLSDFVGTSD